MSFIVPDAENVNYKDEGDIPGNLAQFNSKKGQAVIVDTGRGRMVELDEEAADQPDTVYPTRMTGIAANVDENGQEINTLKKLNSYDTLMNNLSNEYDMAMNKLSDSESLRKSWDIYQNRAVEVHKEFLKEQYGKRTAKLFGQSFVEHLSSQREKYERVVSQVAYTEEINEIKSVTDNALKKMLESNGNESKRNGYIEKAFDQSCEEAYFLGNEDDEQIIEYAQKRLVPTVESIVDQYSLQRDYKSAEKYLDDLGEKISEDDKRIIEHSLFEQKVISKVGALAESGRNDEVFEYISNLPEKLKRMAELSIKQLNTIKFENIEKMKSVALNAAYEQFKQSGIVKSYVMVNGQRMKLDIEDYTQLINSNQNQVNKSELKSDNTDGNKQQVENISQTN